MTLHLDFETRSAVDLKTVGAWNYALHPSTEILCMGLGSVVPGNPGQFVTVLKAAEVKTPPSASWDWSKLLISAHNAAFEYAVYNLILHRRYGWPARWNPALWTCTMARAAMCGLPLDLDGLTRALGCKTPKDLDGRRVMHQLCKPTHHDDMGMPVYDETSAKMERLYQYNASDVRAEMEVDSLLPQLPASEQRVWELDLVMNRRGVAIDTALARAAAPMAEKVVGDLNARLKTLTGGAVDKATQVAALKNYLSTAHGINTESLDKVAITNLLADPKTPPAAREVLLVRRQVGKKTSVAKYQKALEVVCPDGRARGQLQYHAAHTGRWGGRLLQPQNFPKGFDETAQAAAIAAIMDGTLTAKYNGGAMDALSDSLRGLFVAAPGKVLVSADFNAIEARGLFWLAGEESALASYRRGESPYVDMANYIYRRSDLTKKGNPQEYAIGKATVLGAGFGMGWQKFRDNIYIETAKTGKPLVIPDELAERAIKAYREKYSGVVRMWYAVEAAAINAVRNPANVYPCCGGKVLWGMSKDRRFLVCKLPSGRYLWYWKPEIRRGLTPWGEEKDELCYQGEDRYTGQWGRVKTYGGLLTENVVQAVARDIMVNGMLSVEAAGFQMLLTIHDELLAEAVEARGVLENFISIMCKLPPWAAGFPVAAEGWVATRYRK